MEMTPQVYVSLLSACIAFVALIRPELSKIKDYFFGELNFYLSGRTEIGFSEYGPTLAINGTLRTKGNDHFITNTSIKLTRVRDSATYNYKWVVFRNLDYLQAQNSKLEIASAFLLKKGEDKKINILFQDAETLELYKDSLINFANEFQEFFNVQSTTLRSNPNNVRDLFRARNDTGRLDLYGLMGTHFYWQPGNYIFEVTFHTDGSRKSYKFKYGFSLLTSQVETLNLNRVLLLEMAMNAEVKANFAFTETTELSS